MVHKTKKNTEKLATQSTQDEEKHRETGNIGYTRRRKTQRNWQHRVHKTKKNTEKLATQGTQDEEKDPLSFGTSIWIFHNGQPDCDYDRRIFVA